MPKAKPKTKLFILDTNVILDDSECLYNFQDNDIVIPISALDNLASNLLWVFYLIFQIVSKLVERIVNFLSKIFDIKEGEGKPLLILFIIDFTKV